MPKMKYPPQKCSCCKKLIYHYDDRLEERQIDECECNNRGEYYFKSGITSDSSGRSSNHFDNHLDTKIDQEHFQ